MEHESITGELVKMSPPVVLTAGAKFGLITLQDWQCILTIIYAVFGCVYLVLKIRKAWKNRNN